MIIDTHVHESKYSFDSQLDLQEGIKYAKQIGLDGLWLKDE